MKLKPLSLLLMATLGAPLAVQAAETSPHSVSANIGVTSDYLFRGISQTGHDAAIQGGVDYAHSSGFYLGAWGSNVGWIEDYQGYDSGNIELDFYGGFRNSIGDTGISYDVGAIQYYYPGDRNGAVNANTTELYAGLGWKWFTVKYSHTVSDGSFGFSNADGSNYLDISASVPVGETGLTLGAHWGTFNFENWGGQDYDDWKVSLAYDMSKLSDKLEGVTFGVAYSDTDTQKGSGTAFSAPWTDVNGEDLGEGRAFAWITKSFTF